MATVQIGNATLVDMRNARTFYGTVRIATSTQLEIAAGSDVGDYFGQGFTYSLNGAVVGGTLTGYSSTHNGGLGFTATGLNVAAGTAYQLVQSGNAFQFEAIALSGNDTIFGAGNSDVLMGFGGNNTIVGVRAGVDYAAYSGAASAYSISVNSSGSVVSRPDGGQDQLINIKAIKFSDQTVSLSSLPITPDTLGHPVFRFFDTHDGGHFFTTSTAERDQVLATRRDMNFEGVGYNAVDPASSDPNAAPVYRFFDTHDGGHFFTISQAERDQVLNTRPDLKFEGAGYSEHTTQQAGDSAVYRFFETTSGGHFFTASAAERDTVMATRSDMRFEGIAFYAPT